MTTDHFKEKKEEIKGKVNDWLNIITKFIILSIPIVGYVWHTEVGKKFNEFKEELSNEFVTVDYARQHYVSSEQYSNFKTKTNGLLGSHQNNGNIHATPDQFVSKTVYELEKLNEQRLLARLEAATERNSEKLDRLLEMVLTSSLNKVNGNGSNGVNGR